MCIFMYYLYFYLVDSEHVRNVVLRNKFHRSFNTMPLETVIFGSFLRL